MLDFSYPKENIVSAVLQATPVATSECFGLLSKVNFSFIFFRKSTWKWKSLIVQVI